MRNSYNNIEYGILLFCWNFLGIKSDSDTKWSFFLLKNFDFNLWGFLRRNLVLICSKEQRLIDDDIHCTISPFLAHYLHQLVRKIISMYLLIKKFKKTFLKIDGSRFFFLLNFSNWVAPTWLFAHLLLKNVKWGQPTRPKYMKCCEQMD